VLSELGRGLDHGGATVAQEVQRGVQRARSWLEQMLSELDLDSDVDDYDDAEDSAAFADGDVVGGVLPLSPSGPSPSVRTGASQPPPGLLPRRVYQLPQVASVASQVILSMMVLVKRGTSARERKGSGEFEKRARKPTVPVRSHARKEGPST